MSNVSQINVGNNTYDIKDTTARSGLANKQDIIQKTTLPTASSTEEGNIYQYIGATGNGLTNGYFYKCVENNGVYSWVRINVQPSSGGSAVQSDWNQTDDTADDYIKNKPDIPDEIQYSTMPTASNEFLNCIIQYTGTSNSTYTNGYFYKCVPGSTSGTYVWVPLNVQHVCEVETMPEASEATAGKVYHYVGQSTEYYDKGAWYIATPNAPYMIYKITENYTPTEKTKLSEIATGATANTVIDTTCSLTVNGWSGSSAPYSQSKSVTGILSTDKAICDLSVSSTVSTGLDQIDDWALISRIVSGNGTLTFYCYEDKPTVALTVNVKVVR